MSKMTTWHVYARRSKGYGHQWEVTTSDRDAARRYGAKLWGLPLDDVLAHAVNNCTEECDQ